VFAAAIPGSATPVLGPGAPGSFSLFSLGNVPDVAAQYSPNPYSYQGITINGNSLLLAVGNAATPQQNIFALPLIRTNNHISGFGGSSLYTTVTSENTGEFGNLMAGGLVSAGPNGVLFTTQGYSYLGQGDVPAGNTARLDLTGNTGAFTGGLQYVPSGFSGAGQLKISSFITGDWYTLNLGGSFGSYTLTSFTKYSVSAPAYAFDYLPVNATFTQPSVIVGDAATPGLTVYALDANGNPCPGCAAPMHVVTGTGGIGFGLVRDPLTGDVLFTSWDSATNNSELWLLSEVPEPGTLALGMGGLALAALLHRKRHTALLHSKRHTALLHSKRHTA
jgi:hypothetical protein